MGAVRDKFFSLQLQLTQSTVSQRHLFIKAASSTDEKDGTIPKDCGLFVAGLPFVHQDHQELLRELFSAFGAVTNVPVHPSKTSAIVVFAKASARRKAFEAAQSAQLLQLSVPEPEQPYGLKGWVEAHKALFPGNDVLSRQLDAWTEQYEAEEARRSQEAAAKLADEGWTVVKRKRGGKRTSDGAGAAVGAVAPAAAQAIAASKKERTLVDFYRFQQRDKRRNELLELRQRFAEDKRRIAEMKASRKFKPY